MRGCSRRGVSREAAKPRRETQGGGEWWEWRHPCRTPGHLRTRLACGAFCVARAFQPEPLAVRFGWPDRQLLRAGGPLTPDPSPPFHGGEGRKLVGSGAGLTRSREAAKGNARWRGVVGVAASMPHTRALTYPARLWCVLCSSGFPARAPCCAVLMARLAAVEGEWTPSPSIPLPRFTGARGGVSGQWAGGLTRSREDAKGNARGRGVFGDWRHPCRTPGHLRARLALW
jgi:hypothetical protein